MKNRDQLVTATAWITGQCLEDPHYRHCGERHPVRPALVCEHPAGHAGKHHFTSRFFDGRPGAKP